jgi:hypothetical protein
MGATTPALKRLHDLAGQHRDKSSQVTDKNKGLSITTINRLFMLTLPAHLQLNYGKPLDTTHRDALRAKIIRSALNREA